MVDRNRYCKAARIKKWLATARCRLDREELCWIESKMGPAHTPFEWLPMGSTVYESVCVCVCVVGWFLFVFCTSMSVICQAESGLDYILPEL